MPVEYEVKKSDSDQVEVSRLRGEFAEYFARKYYAEKGVALTKIVYPIGQSDSSVEPEREAIELGTGIKVKSEKKTALFSQPELKINPRLEGMLTWALSDEYGEKKAKVKVKKIITLITPKTKLSGNEGYYDDAVGLPDYIHASREHGIFFVEVKSGKNPFNENQKKTFKRILDAGFKIELIRFRFEEDCSRCGKRHFKIKKEPEEVRPITEADLR